MAEDGLNVEPDRNVLVKFRYRSLVGLRQRGKSERSAMQVIAEIFVALTGIALVVGAAAADRQWLDRHFLPTFLVSRRVYVLVESVARVFTGALGAAALVARARIGRSV